MIIHVFTFSAFGHCASKARCDSGKLGKDALVYLTTLLDNHGNDFQVNLPMRGIGEIELRFTSEHLSCALASFSSGGDLLSTNLVVGGISASADQKVLEMGQTALKNVCAAAEEDPPSEELLGIEDRPALATIRWSMPDRKTMDLLADMEICVAAAFLERSFKSGQIGF